MADGDYERDSLGRPIGETFEAICDEPGCCSEINRGLKYACGGVHGKTDECCDKYFCWGDLVVLSQDEDEDEDKRVYCCMKCSMLNDKRFKTYINKYKIDALKEVLADGDACMGESGVMAGAHWNAIKRKIKDLEGDA